MLIRKSFEFLLNKFVNIISPLLCFQIQIKFHHSAEVYILNWLWPDF